MSDEKGYAYGIGFVRLSDIEAGGDILAEIVREILDAGAEHHAEHSSKPISGFMIHAKVMPKWSVYDD